VTDEARSDGEQGTAPSGRRRRRGPRAAAGQRGIVVKVRLSQAERETLEAKAQAAGLSLAALLRDHLGQVMIRNRDDERQRLALLNRINANLNMVARWANTFKTHADAWAVVTRLEAIQAELSRLLAAWEGSTGDRRVFGIRHRQR
jgi:hypothetical protein